MCPKNSIVVEEFHYRFDILLLLNFLINFFRMLQYPHRNKIGGNQMFAMFMLGIYKNKVI